MEMKYIPFVPAEKRLHLATLEAIEAAIGEHAQIVLPVAGDCMDGAEIRDGGWVAVDFTRFPTRGAPCLCYATFPGAESPAVLLKSYMGIWGPWQLVGTRYGDGRMDLAMIADRIFGVVFAAWDRDGALLWERDPEEFPEELDTSSTIGGEVSPE